MIEGLGGSQGADDGNVGQSIAKVSTTSTIRKKLGMQQAWHLTHLRHKDVLTVEYFSFVGFRIEKL